MGLTKVEMLAALSELAEPSLAGYMEKVVSDTGYPMLYVPMSAVRKVAKAASRLPGSLKGPFTFYEEVVCAGLAIAYAKMPLAQRLTALRDLLPHLDSWAMTDSIFPTLRFDAEEQALLWAFAMECLAGDGEYMVRSGVVILLRFFLTDTHSQTVAARLAALHDDRYYVQMAVAWCFAEMAVNHYEIVEKVLESGELSLFIHNKTIQKMRESYRISAEKKEAAQRLRRK